MIIEGSSIAAATVFPPRCLEGLFLHPRRMIISRQVHINVYGPKLFGVQFLHRSFPLLCGLQFLDGCQLWTDCSS